MANCCGGCGSGFSYITGPLALWVFHLACSKVGGGSTLTLTEMPWCTFLWKNSHQNFKVLKPWVWRDLGWGKYEGKKSFTFWAVWQSQVYQCSIMHDANLATIPVIRVMCSTALWTNALSGMGRSRGRHTAQKACSLTAPSWRWNPPKEVWFGNQQSLKVCKYALKWKNYTERSLVSM